MFENNCKNRRALVAGQNFQGGALATFRFSQKSSLFCTIFWQKSIKPGMRKRVSEKKKMDFTLRQQAFGTLSRVLFGCATDWGFNGNCI